VSGVAALALASLTATHLMTTMAEARALKGGGSSIPRTRKVA
jgi:hypothetical protein